MQAASVPVYATKATTSRVRLLRWSPVHELVAVVFEEAPLTLYRFPWKRVWSCHTSVPPTSLCWSPDGRCLLIGFDDGMIQCLAKENGVALYTYQVEAIQKEAHNGVVCMTWTRGVSRATPISAEVKTQGVGLFPDVPTSFPKHPHDAPTLYKEFEKLHVTSTGFERGSGVGNHGTMLCVGHRDGDVTLFLEANVPIAEFETATFLERGVSSIDLRQVLHPPLSTWVEKSL